MEEHLGCTKTRGTFPLLWQWSLLPLWLLGRGMGRVETTYPKFMNITKSQDGLGWKLISFQSLARGRDQVASLTFNFSRDGAHILKCFIFGFLVPTSHSQSYQGYVGWGNPNC